MPDNQTQTITIKLASEQEVNRPVNSDEVKRVISQSDTLDAKAFEKWLFTYFDIPGVETLASFEVFNESILPPIVARQWNIDTFPYTKEVPTDLAGLSQLANKLARELCSFDRRNSDDYEHLTGIESDIMERYACPEDLGDETEEEYRHECINDYIESYPLTYIETCLDNMESQLLSYKEEDGDVDGAINTARLRFNELKEIATEMGWHDKFFEAHQ